MLKLCALQRRLDALAALGCSLLLAQDIWRLEVLASASFGDDAFLLNTFRETSQERLEAFSVVNPNFQLPDSICLLQIVTQLRHVHGQ